MNVMGEVFPIFIKRNEAVRRTDGYHLRKLVFGKMTVDGEIITVVLYRIDIGLIIRRRQNIEAHRHYGAGVDPDLLRAFGVFYIRLLDLYRIESLF